MSLQRHTHTRAYTHTDTLKHCVLEDVIFKCTLAFINEECGKKLVENYINVII